MKCICMNAHDADALEAIRMHMLHMMQLLPSDRHQDKSEPKDPDNVRICTVRIHTEDSTAKHACVKGVTPRGVSTDPRNSSTKSLFDQDQLWKEERDHRYTIHRLYLCDVDSVYMSWNKV